MTSSRNNLSLANPKPCKHLSDFKLKQGFNCYKTLQKCLKTTPSGRTSLEKPNAKVPTCDSCDGFRGRLYFCLLCSAISCSDHVLAHGKASHGHDIAVDVQRAELYCSKCRDQVYDPDFDSAVMSKHRLDIPRAESDGLSVGERLCKRKRSAPLPAAAAAQHRETRGSKGPKEAAAARDRRAAKSCYPSGLRGLNNLGSTCFMNSVLQALLHLPPLRSHFLAGRHSREACRADGPCLPCEFGDIFSAVFSGNRAPYSPARFLYSWWRHSANLASYEQQDAHEFFISVVDGIHERESKVRNQNRESGDCRCIAHSVFSGLLRSDVTCMTCGYTSTTCDPYVDISLNLDANSYSSMDVGKKPVKPSESSAISSLLGCLDLFTRPEKLGSDQKLYCQNCRERQDASKQLSIRRLPPVLCLHIKRFEHSLIRRMSRKIDSYLHFPFSLDMMPYLSSSIVRNRFGNRIFAFEGDESDISTEFEISAVVTHSGTLESGHYATYLRLRNQWYKCDDAWITEVDEEIVRASQCYMIFYVQKTLFHKADGSPNLWPVSSKEAAFHPIAGYC